MCPYTQGPVRDDVNSHDSSDEKWTETLPMQSKDQCGTSRSTVRPSTFHLSRSTSCVYYRSFKRRAIRSATVGRASSR
jgi:hypothetical protein